MIIRALIFVLAAIVSSPSAAEYLQPAAERIDPYKEYRFCGAPPRAPDGSIYRSSRVITAFKKMNPCPSTGVVHGACPGWQINHIVPLASGGCDAVVNLMWLPHKAKTCTTDWCVDRWERKYWKTPRGIIGPADAD